MAIFTVKTKGFKRLEAKLKKAPPEVLKRVVDQINRSTINVDRMAKRFSPVDTGRLRSSIRFEIVSQGQAGRVFTDVEYAIHVEFGTSKVGARSFLGRAHRIENPKFIKALTKILNAAV